MKRPFNEQLSRIYKLTYGKNIIKETILDDLISRIQNPTTNKIDDPRKADFVSRDVKDFYDTLDSIDRPLFQQEHGSMQYQKEVETVQIALLLLGYKLPLHGVDGLFGPETGAAVNQFKSDNNISDDGIISEAPLESPVPIIGVNSPFGAKRSYENHPGVDLKANSGTPIKSPADGKVIDAQFKSTACGGTIQIQHANGFTSRYCHCKDINVTPGQDVKQGDVVGLSGGAAGDRGAGNSMGAHLHFELKKDGQLVNPLDYINKEIGSYDFAKSTSTASGKKAYITPSIIKIIIDKLKEKNISSDDLQQYIDVATITGGGVNFTQLDILSNDGYAAYSKICENFIKTRKSNLLNISGDMLARGARKAYRMYKKLVPAELALAQLTIEGGFSSDPKARPIKTKNPFNVGNVDTGQNVFYDSVQGGIDKYYLLIAGQYLTRGKTADDLVRNFVNREGNRYASAQNYESSLSQIINKVNIAAKPVYDSLGPSSDSVAAE